MSYFGALRDALARSIDVAVQATRTAARMEVVPSARSQGAYPLWSISSQQSNARDFAVGSDKDVGGLSSCRLAYDDGDGGKGRFYGTLSSELPRKAQIQRSGYAAFRNRNRPTIFGNQTWDTTLHPYLLVRVRNRIASAGPATTTSSSSSSYTPSLASALHTPEARVKAAARLSAGAPLDLRALHAIGLGLDPADTPGPKYYVNIQTDGPVTSDLFQHRLWLDPSKGNEWQEVVIPFADFVLLNAGTVASSQMEMMREKVRTIGISATLSNPGYTSEPRKAQAGRPEEAAQQVDNETAPAAPSALRAPRVGDGGSDASAAHGRGSQRGQTFNFDLGVDGVWAVGEDRLDGVPEGVEVPRDSLL